MLQDVKSLEDIIDIFDFKSVQSYGQDIRASVRGLWNGTLGLPEFVDGMESAIRRGFSQAWAEALQSVGLSYPDDMTPEERAALQDAITNEIGFTFQFGIDIEQNSKANGGKLTPLLQRVEMWVNRYHAINARALTMVQSDPALKWIMDPRKENCSSCAKLNGKVKRASFWRDNGILPAVAGAPYLECQGFNCGCVLQPVNEPLSKGRLPGLP